MKTTAKSRLGSNNLLRNPLPDLGLGTDDDDSGSEDEKFRVRKLACDECIKLGITDGSCILDVQTP